MEAGILPAVLALALPIIFSAEEAAVFIKLQAQYPLLAEPVQAVAIVQTAEVLGAPQLALALALLIFI